MKRYSSHCRVAVQTKATGGLVRPYCAVIWLCGALVCNAAEIHLRGECQCASGLVRLGDVAEIHAGDAAEATQLSEIELCAAPAAGSKSFLRAREIQDLLALRGLNLSKHRLSGASQVEIRNGGKAEIRLPISPAIAQRTTERAQNAIAAYLRQQVPENDGGWLVEMKLNDDQVRTLSASKNELIAAGGEAPWAGRQEFTVALPTDAGEQSVVVLAKVSPAPMVVIATRALVPGEMVQETDVKLAQLKPGRIDSPFYRLQEVIGKETKRAIVAGQPLDEDDLRSPLIVRRGDAVTVYARSAGVRVRTDGRATEDGSRGDLIVVQSMMTPDKFRARVSGIREVEIFAQASEAATVIERPAKPTSAETEETSRLARLIERTQKGGTKPGAIVARRRSASSTANRSARLPDPTEPSNVSPGEHGVRR